MIAVLSHVLPGQRSPFCTACLNQVEQVQHLTLGCDVCSSIRVHLGLRASGNAIFSWHGMFGLWGAKSGIIVNLGLKAGGRACGYSQLVEVHANIRAVHLRVCPREKSASTITCMAH